MVIVESADGKKKEIKCIGCSIQKGEIKSVGGKVAETKNFDVHQDYEIPIPGFIILASKKHLKGIGEFSKDERIEFIELLYSIRRALKEILGVDYVYIIQEEDSITRSSHFHVWIFPRYEWMERFGERIESVRPIMEYARKNMKTKNGLKKVKETAEKLRRYLKEMLEVHTL